MHPREVKAPIVRPISSASPCGVPTHTVIASNLPSNPGSHRSGPRSRSNAKSSLPLGIARGAES